MSMILTPTPCGNQTLRITRLRGPLFPRNSWHFTHCADTSLFRCFHFFTQCPPWPPSNLAPHQSWPAGWPGHRVCGLPTMYGFPTMYLASPPCILIKGIRISGIRYQVSEKRRKKPQNMIFPKVKNKFQRIARFEAMTP